MPKTEALEAMKRIRECGWKVELDIAWLNDT
jgi:hypothetical protein